MRGVATPSFLLSVWAVPTDANAGSPRPPHSFSSHQHVCVWKTTGEYLQIDGCAILLYSKVQFFCKDRRETVFGILKSETAHICTSIFFIQFLFSLLFFFLSCQFVWF